MLRTSYATHIIIPQNIKIGEPELKNAGEEYQDNNEPIIHNTIMNARWNKIADMIQEFVPLFQYN